MNKRQKEARVKELVHFAKICEKEASRVKIDLIDAYTTDELRDISHDILSTRNKMELLANWIADYAAVLDKEAKLARQNLSRKRKR